MHIVVCIKQVPDTTEIKIDPVTNTLIRENIPSIVNPFDVNAVEEALRIKEKYGGTIEVISMGPPQAVVALRKLVSLGVDEAILLSDRAFAGADTLATAYTLTQTIQKMNEKEKVDMVFCGKQAIDGDTGQVGPGIATRLGWSQLTYVTKIVAIEPEKRDIQVQRKVDGRIETVSAPLPTVITVIKEINTPRYPTLNNRLEANKYVPSTWNKVSIDAIPEKIGMQGSPTSVKKIFTAPPRTVADKITVDCTKDTTKLPLAIEKIIPLIKNKGE